MSERVTRRTRGDGGLFRRPALSRFWYIQWYDLDGKVHRESSGTESRQKAQAILRDRLGKRDAGEPVIPTKVTFTEAADALVAEYRATGNRNPKEVEKRLAPLRASFGPRAIRTIDEDTVTAYVEARRRPTTLEDGTVRPGKANGTINRELGILQRVLKLAARRRKLARVPTITLLREDNARQGFFERDQYEAVRAQLHARPDVQVVIDIAYTLGWRVRDEILPLTWNRVDLDKLTLRLDPGTTKNRDGREVSLRMFPHLVDALREQRARVEAFQKATGRIIPYVFPHLDPKSAHAGTQLSDFRKTWATALHRAGLTGKLKHDFRRTAVRNMERAGVPRSVAMKITGHRTELIYRRYAIVDAAAIDEGLAKLAALHRADTQASPKVVPIAQARG
jgi:hypothetical protein